MAGSMAGGQIFANPFVESQQPDRVTLQVEEISQGGRQRIGVLRLAVSERTVSHRTAVIDEQLAAEVGFVLELLDVVAIRTRVEPPIQITRVVAGRILPV